MNKELENITEEYKKNFNALVLLRKLLEKSKKNSRSKRLQTQLEAQEKKVEELRQKANKEYKEK